MADAPPERGTKRPASAEASELEQLRRRVLAQMAALSSREEAEVVAAVDASPNATILELGLTSAQGLTLRGWALRELEAELTAFQLLKQPFPEVLAQISAAQRENLGVSLPEVSPPPLDGPLAEQRANEQQVA